VKDVVVIGGPNGAGKSTAANRIFPKSLGLRHFLNADEIARGLSPYDPSSAAIAAGRVLIETIDTLVHSGQSFAFETTCAGRGHLQRLRLCRSAGYRITLIFLWLPSAEMALARVAHRVAHGGHGIPDDVVLRRYAAGLRNMRHHFLPLADVAVIYDNSERGRVLVAEKHPDSALIVYDTARWQIIEDATH
jgi:predicted ABC-type ATPase